MKYAVFEAQIKKESNISGLSGFERGVNECLKHYGRHPEYSINQALGVDASEVAFLGELMFLAQRQQVDYVVRFFHADPVVFEYDPSKFSKPHWSLCYKWI